MADDLELAIEKALLSIEAAKGKWASDLQNPAAFEEYVDNFARAAGLDPAEVRRSIPAVKWAIFARQADRYSDKWYKNTVNGFRKKWKDNLRRAFTTPAPAELLAQAGLM